MNKSETHISLSLVIPCYNEASRLEIMFGGIKTFMEKWQGPLEVVIVNDGSKDDTGSLVASHPLFCQHPDVFKLISQENTGKGGALKCGVATAKGDYILTLDADMASPPDELLTWLITIGGRPEKGTIYIGSREHQESVITKKGNRKFIGNVFNLLTRIFSPLHIRDTQCGFKLYPAVVAQHLFAGLKTMGWAHDVEILYKAQLDKCEIIEMPLNWHAVEGSKIVVLRDGIKMFLELISIVVRTRFTYKPSPVAPK